MCDITFTATDTKISVNSPYSPSFVSRAKEIGGKWDASNRAWTFRPDVEDLVRKALTDIYGWAEGVPLHRQTVEFDADLLEEELNSWCLDGRRVVTRYYRDSAVKIADGAAVVSGKFTSSGGSMRNPRVERGDDDVILRMSLTDKELAWLTARKNAHSWFAHSQITVVNDKEQRLEELTKRREALREQLAQIEKEIETLQAD